MEEKKKCVHCGEKDPAWLEYTECPYAYEIHGDCTEAWRCITCLRDAAEDIQEE